MKTIQITMINSKDEIVLNAEIKFKGSLADVFKDVVESVQQKFGYMPPEPNASQN